jgi:retron-type reverse transcriptase
MKTYDNIFRKIIHPVNLFRAWDEFVIGKKKKVDVMSFAVHLEENIFDLCHDLKYHNYKHDVYHSFFITDPKLREIHKATVRDRVLHHAIFRILNPIFEPTFINDSFSCRIDKGNHKGVKRLAEMIGKVSKNHTKRCFVLKCDIKKFFDSVDHQILMEIIQKKIVDLDAI